jgi:hypothetical protein
MGYLDYLNNECSNKYEKKKLEKKIIDVFFYL